MGFGKWEVKVEVGKMPQKVATAFAEYGEKIVGAQYNMIAYLGSQVVNGTNHAVLAEQTVLTGKDTKNIVVLIFRETPEGVTLTSIDRVLEDGGEFGGVKIEVMTDIPEEMSKVFDDAFTGFVGTNVRPFAMLGTQMTKGMNYIFAAEASPVVPNPETKVALVIVNPVINRVHMIDILPDKHVAAGFGYAFTW